MCFPLFSHVFSWILFAFISVLFRIGNNSSLQNKNSEWTWWTTILKNVCQHLDYLNHLLLLLFRVEETRSSQGGRAGRSLLQAINTLVRPLVQCFYFSSISHVWETNILILVSGLFHYLKHSKDEVRWLPPLELHTVPYCTIFETH